MSKIDTTGWKEFKIHEIFQVDYGNKFDKNKMSHNHPTINFVSRTANNNGVSDVVDEIPNATLFPAGSLTLALGGSIGSCFLQEKPFYTGQNVGVIQFDDTVPYEARLFVACSISKKCKTTFTAFANEINKHLKTDLSILLPVKEEDVIDYEYMEERIRELEEERIRELEEERIRELETYLKAANLEDDTLTEEEQQTLYNDVNLIQFESFAIGDLFKIEGAKKRFNANAVSIFDKRVDTAHPYIVRTSQNNGMRGYIIQDEQYLLPGNTFSFGQDTATVFYQTEAYFTGDKIKSLQPIGFELSEDTACYIMTAIRKAFSHFQWGQNSFNETVLKNTKIILPVGLDGKPDFTFMTFYITAQKKLAIQSVNAWRKKEIETTKKLVKSDDAN